MKTEKIIHRGWEEWQKIPQDIKKSMQGLTPEGYFGKWQYFFYSEEDISKKISMVELYDSFDKKWYWEIFAFDNEELFIDVRKFKTKAQAIKKVKNYLRPPKPITIEELLLCFEAQHPKLKERCDTVLTRKWRDGEGDIMLKDYDLLSDVTCMLLGILEGKEGGV